MFAAGKNRGAWFVVLVLTGIVIYLPGIGTHYYADDFAFLMDTSSFADFYRYFARAVPWINYYRPFQASFLWLVQKTAGPDTTAIHLVQLVLNALLAGLVFSAIRKLGFSPRHAGLGSMFMVVSQANVHAVLSNDTFSQVCSTLFGFLSVCFVYERLHSRETPAGAAPRHRSRLPAVLCLLLALFCKETGVAYVAVIGFILLLAGGSESRRRTVRSFVPFVLAAACYVFVWSQVVDREIAYGAGTGDIRVGPNVPVNAACFLLAVSTPVSSVDVYVALKSQDTAAFGSYLTATAAFVCLVLTGLAASGAPRRLIGLLALLVVVSWFPSLLMNHVSELYAYNAMPFVCVLTGIALGAVTRPGDRRRRVRVVGTAAVIALFASHCVAVSSKVRLMHAAGERASALRRQIERYIPLLPSGGRLVLINPDSDEIEYSIYRLNGFNVLRLGGYPLGARSGRSDVEITLLDRPPAPRAPAGERPVELWLTLRGNDVVQWVWR